MRPILDPRDPLWAPPSNRPEVPIVLFEMRELETMLPVPFPSLRLQALVEWSCSAQVRLTVGDSEV